MDCAHPQTLTIDERARLYVQRVLTEPRSDELIDRIADVIRPALNGREVRDQC